MAVDPVEIEHRFYSQRFDDGLVDVFVGLALVGIGVGWLTPAAAFAGLWVPLLVPFYAPIRRRVVEPRSGYVRFSAARREQERRSHGLLVGLGVFVLLLGVFGYLVASGAESGDALLRSLAPGLPAGLLALAGVVSAAAFDVPRFGGYGAVLAACGLLTIALGVPPALPLLAGGVVVSAAAFARLARFLREHPLEGA